MRERRTVGDDSIVHLVHTGVERRSSGRARSGLGIVTRETYSLVRQSIQGRRTNKRVSRRSVRVTAKLIEGDEENVHVVVVVTSRWR